jgi:acetyl-CoA synthetase
MISTSSQAAAADDYQALYQGFHWHVPSDFNIAWLCAGRWAGDAGRVFDDFAY